MIGLLFYLKDSYNFFAHHATKNVSLIPSKFCGLLSIPLQGFNRLVQSCPIHYHNSCKLCHGTCLEVLSFNYETMYLWPCLS